MTVPQKYANHFMPVKYFLASYRALSDGRGGIGQLEEQLSSAGTLLFNWKVTWAGTCAVLRTAIDLFKVDSNSCLSPHIREEIEAEWQLIRGQKDKHAIFWDFLKRERDNIIHGYRWESYEAWIKPDGTFRGNRLSLLEMAKDDGACPILLMNGGPFKGYNSLDLLNEGANWVENRIFGAIRRAGFDPEEQRGLVNFQPRPKLEDGLLSALRDDKKKEK